MSYVTTSVFGREASLFSHGSTPDYETNMEILITVLFGVPMIGIGFYCLVQFLRGRVDEETKNAEEYYNKSKTKTGPSARRIHIFLASWPLSSALSSFLVSGRSGASVEFAANNLKA